jgi:sarcosine oxidase subunit beta
VTTLNADVVVVGGGFMGASSAFFLRQRNRSVILVERDLIGQQASGVNFGNVRRQARNLAQLPLANRSRAIWGQLPSLIGEDAEFLATGHIRVCYDHEWIDSLEDYVQNAREYGLELEMISRKGLSARFPFIGPEAVAGSFSPEDGHANPRLAAPAFGRAAARLGAQVLEKTEIVSIEKTGEDFELVTADGGCLRAPAVLVTAGCWGGILSAQLGEPVPIVARGPQMAVTEPLPYLIEPVIGLATNIPEEAVYIRQVARGNVVYGGGLRGPAYPDIRRAYVVPDNSVSQFSQVRRLVPALACARVIRTWSGIEGYLSDDLPIMGPSAHTAGLFYAFGFCGHGFQLGPGVGDVMAELIDRGASTTPIEAFDINRFSDAEQAA